MGAYVKFIRKEDEKIVRKYLDSDGVVLVFPEMQEEVKELGVKG